MTETMKIDELTNRIARALMSKTRMRIHELLKTKKLNVSQIAECMKQTEANIAVQVKILEKAGLIKSHYEPGEHGVQKICESVKITLEL